MKFAKKFEKLMGSTSLTEQAKILDLTPTSISRYMQGAVPSSDLGCKIARAFDVDHFWLFDDDKDFNDRNDPGVSLTDRQLMSEFIRRAMANIERLETLVAMIEQFDWEKISQDIQDGGRWCDSLPTEVPVKLSMNQNGTALALARALVALLHSPTYMIIRHYWGEMRPRKIIERIDQILEHLRSKRIAKEAFNASMVNYEINDLDLGNYIEYLERLASLVLEQSRMDSAE